MTLQRLLFGVLIGFAGVAGSAGFDPGRVGSAQDSAPVASPVEASCSVQPRSLADLLATPIAASDPVEVRPVLPEGESVGPVAAEGVTRTVRELEACTNSGELLRFLALFTDAALVQLHLNTDEAALSEFAAVATAPPTPFPPGERAVFAGPWHLELLPDDRVLAAVTWFGGEADICVDPSRVRVLVFVERDRRWLVDEMIEQVAERDLIDVVGPPPAGSATATLALCEEDAPNGSLPTDN